MSDRVPPTAASYRWLRRIGAVCGGVLFVAFPIAEKKEVRAFIHNVLASITATVFYDSVGQATDPQDAPGRMEETTRVDKLHSDSPASDKYVPIELTEIMNESDDILHIDSDRESAEIISRSRRVNRDVE